MPQLRIPKYVLCKMVRMFDTATVRNFNLDDAAKDVAKGDPTWNMHYCSGCHMVRIIIAL